MKRRAPHQQHPDEALELGEHLKEQLRKTGLHQKEIAKELNFSVQTMSRYLTGQGFMPEDVLNRILDLTGAGREARTHAMRLWDIINGTTPARTTASPMPVVTSPKSTISRSDPNETASPVEDGQILTPPHDLERTLTQAESDRTEAKQDAPEHIELDKAKSGQAEPEERERGQARRTSREKARARTFGRIGAAAGLIAVATVWGPTLLAPTPTSTVTCSTSAPSQPTAWSASCRAKVTLNRAKNQFTLTDLAPDSSSVVLEYQLNNGDSTRVYNGDGHTTAEKPPKIHTLPTIDTETVITFHVCVQDRNAKRKADRRIQDCGPPITDPAP